MIIIWATMIGTGIILSYIFGYIFLDTFYQNKKNNKKEENP